MDALDKAIRIAGSQSKLAARLGVTRQHISNWRRRGVPPIRCREIEAATDGEVTCYDLLPDVFGPPGRHDTAASSEGA